MRRQFFSLAVLAVVLPLLPAGAPAPRTAKEALQPFNDLIGSWRCTVEPIASREEVQKNFRTETLSVEWQFKGNDAWLKLDFKKDKDSRHDIQFTKGELRYRPASNDYELKLQTVKKETLNFTGGIQERTVTFERQQAGKVERLVFTLLHSNRFLYRFETRPMDKTLVTRLWKVGATKEGESFAVGESGPECIVSGGKGTMAVTYQGKTYYVCCSGCRSEFDDHPQKYIDEYNAKKAKKSK